jgi:ABC-type hemin transport system ATPase subunit
MKSSTYDDSSGMPATPEKALCGSVSAKTGAVRWRTPDEAVREALEQEVADMRAVLREWLALDESFTHCDFAFLREMVAKGHRLAPVVLRTRLLLTPNTN